jgi:hypothetical protein
MFSAPIFLLFSLKIYMSLPIFDPTTGMRQIQFGQFFRFFEIAYSSSISYISRHFSYVPQPEKFRASGHQIAMGGL